MVIQKANSNWVQTSYNSNIRKQFAGIGYTYDDVNDVFITPQPYPSWSLDDNFDWQTTLIGKPQHQCQKMINNILGMRKLKLGMK